MSKFDSKNISKGSKVFIITYFSYGREEILSIGEVQRITEKRRDIVLKSGEVFTDYGHGKNNGSFHTNSKYLLEYTQENVDKYEIQEAQRRVKKYFAKIGDNVTLMSIEQLNALNMLCRDIVIDIDQKLVQKGGNYEIPQKN